VENTSKTDNEWDQIFEYDSDETGKSVCTEPPLRENIRSGRTMLGDGVYWNAGPPVTTQTRPKFDDRNDPINCLLELAGQFEAPNQSWCCHSCGGWWWRKGCGYDVARKRQSKNAPPEGTTYRIEVNRTCGDCRGQVGIHADRFGTPTGISHAGTENFDGHAWSYHGGDLRRLADGVFQTQPKPVWCGGERPHGYQILQNPRHLFTMAHAYIGAPPISIVTAPSDFGEVYSVMRITRDGRRIPDIPGYHPPPRNPAVALGNRMQFQMDMHLGRLGQIPFFCECCHGFWWPEFHPYAVARLQNNTTITPIVQAFQCEECGGSWEREAIFQSMPAEWHFFGLQLVGRFFWVFLGAELVEDNRDPEWVTARQYTPWAVRSGIVPWRFRDLPDRVVPNDGWEITRVPEDDSLYLPPPPWCNQPSHGGCRSA
jgi:hypothetical protein